MLTTGDRRAPRLDLPLPWTVCVSGTLTPWGNRNHTRFKGPIVRFQINSKCDSFLSMTRFEPVPHLQAKTTIQHLGVTVRIKLKEKTSPTGLR